MNSCFFKLVHVHVILRPRFTAPTPIPHSLSRVPGDRTRANLELSSKRDISWAEFKMAAAAPSRPPGKDPPTPAWWKRRRPWAATDEAATAASAASAAAATSKRPILLLFFALVVASMPNSLLDRFLKNLIFFFNTTNTVCAFGFLLLVSLFVFINFRAGILHIDFLMWQP